MLKNHNLLRGLSIFFIVLIGYALARAFYFGSFMGVILALISLGAILYFFYTLNSIRKEMESDNAY
jgi:hypothetical protein